MSQDNKDKLIKGHEYDGIQELDNPLPKWWLFTFYITIVFAVGYYGYYEMFGGPSSQEYLARSLKQISAQQQVSEEQKPKAEEEITEELIAQTLASEGLMAEAKAQYEGKCAACHKADGGGLVGPNLTDSYWIHSKGDVKGILTAIRNGFPAKGMPPWADLVPKKLHLALALYAKNLPEVKGKEPQGELVE